jgi:hypothetical protein
MNLDRLLRVVTRIPGARALWLKFPVGSVELRVQYGVWRRPNYAYGCFHAADLARRLGLGGITVIELGVAGGNGLVALEEVAAAVSAVSGIEIDVAGFDSGAGMPAPVDYRDLPHVWDRGFYKMDVDRLRKRLTGAELCLGDIRETIPGWLERRRHPIGFIAFDLDYYSSTMNAFTLFESTREISYLPRVYCYFDDLMWPEHACHNEYTGELRAIRDFNDRNENRKICPISMLRHIRPQYDPWNDQMYVMHDFAHPQYCRNITLSGAQHREIPLQAS